MIRIAGLHIADRRFDAAGTPGEVQNLKCAFLLFCVCYYYRFPGKFPLKIENAD